MSATETSHSDQFEPKAVPVDEAAADIARLACMLPDTAGSATELPLGHTPGSPITKYRNETDTVKLHPQAGIYNRQVHKYSSSDLPVEELGGAPGDARGRTVGYQAIARGVDSDPASTPETHQTPVRTYSEAVARGERHAASSGGSSDGGGDLPPTGGGGHDGNGGTGNGGEDSPEGNGEEPSTTGFGQREVQRINTVQSSQNFLDQLAKSGASPEVVKGAQALYTAQLESYRREQDLERRLEAAERRSETTTWPAVPLERLAHRHDTPEGGEVTDDSGPILIDQRTYEERRIAMVRAAITEGISFTEVAGDLDAFKQANLVLTHAGADEVLITTREIMDVVSQNVRGAAAEVSGKRSDIVVVDDTDAGNLRAGSRIGRHRTPDEAAVVMPEGAEPSNPHGDEFRILLPGANESGGKIVANRLMEEFDRAIHAPGREAWAAVPGLGASFAAAEADMGLMQTGFDVVAPGLDEQGQEALRADIAEDIRDNPVLARMIGQSLSKDPRRINRVATQIALELDVRVERNVEALKLDHFGEAMTPEREQLLRIAEEAAEQAGIPLRELEKYARWRKREELRRRDNPHA